MPMHADQVELSDAAVKRLVASQFPRWADLPLARIRSGGTSNALYRLGQELALRLPLLADAAEDAQREAEHLPRIAPHLPLAIPAPIAVGAPAEGYPFAWSVTSWLAGTDAFTTPPADLRQAAHDMAAFIRALRAIPVAVPVPPRGRGGSLAPRDARVQSCLGQLEGEIDTAAAAAAWAQSLAAPAYDGPPRWLHGDLHPANLLVAAGRISGVIDWGTFATGDPATELLFAWMVLDRPARALFRELIDVDPASWLRGRGWALSMAVIALPYYLDSNPTLVAISRRAIAEVLADFTG